MRDFISPDDTSIRRRKPAKRVSGAARVARAVVLVGLAFGAVAGLEAARRAYSEPALEYTQEGVPIYKRTSYRVLGDGTIVYPPGHEPARQHNALVPHS